MTPRERAAIEARALALREEALDARAKARPDLVCPGCGAAVTSRTPGARCPPCAQAKRVTDAREKERVRAAARRAAREQREREQRRTLYFERLSARNG
jgi:hypothetical protein